MSELFDHFCRPFHQVHRSFPRQIDATIIHAAVFRQVEILYHVEHLCYYPHRLLDTHLQH